ncbi:MAG TPA: hypothetical protein VJ011_00385 [Steroidobacteraceae bacterium]|nr:hypothetical protein [Steroidobacteraceae bacterium]
MKSLVVAPRFCGPPASANGGYIAGLFASIASGTVAVRLLKPPPLAVELQVHEAAGGSLELRHGDEVVALASPATLDVVPPAAPTYLEALSASTHHTDPAANPFPTCFVCGPQRARGDGLRIFAGPLPREPRTVAAPWTPDASLDQGDGKVRAEFMWAALDCPGYFAASADSRLMLLGEFTAHVDRRVHVDERCIIVAWSIASSGRKHVVGSALYDDNGEPCARARAVWIEPRAPAEKS